MKKVELTKNNIKNAAKNEFLKFGFKEASLRNIALNAGVTTGAIYGCYKNKSEIFNDIVSEVANGFFHIYDYCEKDFFDGFTDKNDIDYIYKDYIYVEKILNLLYDHFEESKILICCAEGTKYENFVDMAVEKSNNCAKRMINVYEADDSELNLQLIHIICSADLTSILELIKHDVPREKAIKQGKKIVKFFKAGWETLL